MSRLKIWWAQLGSREHRLILLASSIVALALIWLLALAPAVKVLRSAAKDQAAASVSLQTMQLLAEQAGVLRAQRALGYDESLRNLENSLKQTLGNTASLSVSETRANVTLKGANADALALWLTQARINARALPSEARLQRSTANANTSSAAVSASWDGSLVLTLPSR